MMRTPVHLITGFAGAGKTSLLRALLTRRALHVPSESWALLLNGGAGDFNAEGVFVKQLAQGCACCTARVSFRAALVQLLRAARPQRLLIELSGVADPAAVKAVFNEAAIAQVVALRGTLCVIDPTQWHDTRMRQHEAYVAQLRNADHFVINGTADAAALLSLPHPSRTLLQEAGLSLLDTMPPTHSKDSSRQISS